MLSFGGISTRDEYGMTEIWNVDDRRCNASGIHDSVLSPRYHIRNRISRYNMMQGDRGSRLQVPCLQGFQGQFR
jgi:hypothetical protein